MLNLDKIHKIGELAAAIAVVISPLFVGMEIQQNNQIQKQLATTTKEKMRERTEAWEGVLQ